MTAVIATLLALAVFASWLGALGFARLKDPLDRLHAVTFVNAATGLPILLAGLIADGASDRVAKLALLVAACLWSGAALAHATGRAIRARDKAQ
jgi:multicomponent Na+:H+ antiporter subunit G